ncbi:hypothetical protein H2200_012773 [Cladophialophora chaetospira]|uniref:Uncharacterized protein n=1 Tax=Cladophialophora chaetospira TaxID=386627 RepID=A0AA38WWU1_9EURO|nr:hypothetical protein H2200_012773 [Cladophialophora chaetospira]
MDPSTGHGFVPTQRNDTYPFIDPLKSNFADQNVLITGSARGLGKQMALSYAKAGASGIALLDILDAEPVRSEILEAAKTAGHPEPKFISVKVDVTSEQSVTEAFKTVSAKFDSLDFVINNAGTLAGYIPLVKSEPSKWWRDWEVNVKGPYLISRAFMPLVLKGKQKTFVVVSSVGAHFTLPGGSAYESSKLAVLKLNYYLNVEHESDGVLAYAIAPGGVFTAMASTFPVELHDRLTDTPYMVADTLVFLTRERREWLANRYIDSRWDMEELMAKKEEIVQKDLLKVRMAL